MAIYRFSMKHGSTGNGSSGGAHARYILREEQYSYASHQLVYSESGNMPSWVNSPTDFWDAADEHERKNARVYTEFEVAFPRELTLDQQVRLAQDFVAYEIADLHPYTFAIHNVQAQDGGENPHAHIMFTTRTLDGIERGAEQFFKRYNQRSPENGGAEKEREWMQKYRLEQLRESWEEHANRALKRAGLDITIDHRTLKAQGIDRAPEPKLTPYEAMLWKQGVVTERVEEIILLREIAALQQREVNPLTPDDLRSLERVAELTTEHDEIYDRVCDAKAEVNCARVEVESAQRRVVTLEANMNAFDCSDIDHARERAFERLYGESLRFQREEVERARAAFDDIRERVTDHLRNPVKAVLRAGEVVKDMQAVKQAEGRLTRLEQTFQKLELESVSRAGQRRCEETARHLVAETAERHRRYEQSLMTLETCQKVLSERLDGQQTIEAGLTAIRVELRGYGVYLDPGQETFYLEEDRLMYQLDHEGYQHRLELSLDPSGRF